MGVAPSFNGASGHNASPENVKIFLALTASGSNMAILGMIEEHGAGLLEVRDEKGRTPVIRAAETGRHGAIHLLVKSGADINATDNNGNTALMIAAELGYRGVAQALLDRHADMEIANHKGQTALHLAATHRNNNDGKHPMSIKKKETVQLLLERGAGTEAKDHQGHTPETWARRFKYLDVADMIAAEAKRRAEEHDAQMSLFTEGIPENVTLPRLRLRHHHGHWKP